MNLRSIIQKHIQTHQNHEYFQSRLIQPFLNKLKDPKILKKQNTPSHLCVMFIPFYQTSNNNIYIYLGHHKKADDWIVPGGHIEPNETPTQTVIREFKEELNFDIKPNQVQFFNIAIKPVNKPHWGCVTHYDLWYAIRLPNRIDFEFITSEYYQARWVQLEEVKNYTRHNPLYVEIILSLPVFLKHHNI